MEHAITPITLKRRASIIKNKIDARTAEMMRDGQWTYHHSRQYITDSDNLRAIERLSPKTLASIFGGTKPEDWTVERASELVDKIEQWWDL